MSAVTITKSPDDASKEVVSYYTMRKTIGWLGMALPFILLIGNLIINTYDLFNSKTFVKTPPDYAGYVYKSEASWKSSVSHYYYTTTGEIFTGTLFAVALFMICYTGHKKRDDDFGLSDNAMTNIAGWCAIGVATFPTSADVSITDNLRRFISSETVGYIHYAFAGTFFVTLALMSLINFRRTDNKGFGMGADDAAYKTYGIIMLLCIVLVGVFGYLSSHGFESLRNYNITFILEAIALVAFGTSWLRKGRADFMYLPKKLGFGKKKQAG